MQFFYISISKISKCIYRIQTCVQCQYLRNAAAYSLDPRECILDTSFSIKVGISYSHDMSDLRSCFFSCFLFPFFWSTFTLFLSLFFCFPFPFVFFLFFLFFRGLLRRFLLWSLFLMGFFWCLFYFFWFFFFSHLVPPVALAPE